MKESREEGKSTPEITRKEIPGVLYLSYGVVLINVHMESYSHNSKTNYYTKYYFERTCQVPRHSCFYLGEWTTTLWRTAGRGRGGVTGAGDNDSRRPDDRATDAPPLRF